MQIGICIGVGKAGGVDRQQVRLSITIALHDIFNLPQENYYKHKLHSATADSGPGSWKYRTQAGFNLCKCCGCGTPPACSADQVRSATKMAALWALELKICCPLCSAALLAACVQLQTHKFPFPFDTWQPIKLVKKYSNKGQQPRAAQRAWDCRRDWRLATKLELTTASGEREKGREREREHKNCIQNG